MEKGGGSMVDQRLLYKVTEAAKLLSLSRSEVYKLLAQGTLKSVRVGRARRIPAAELHRFVEGLVVVDRPSRADTR
jgi:excisionase family DNA binding protein